MRSKKVNLQSISMAQTINEERSKKSSKPEIIRTKAEEKPKRPTRKKRALPKVVKKQPAAPKASTAKTAPKKKTNTKTTVKKVVKKTVKKTTKKTDSEAQQLKAIEAQLKVTQTELKKAAQLEKELLKKEKAKDAARKKKVKEVTAKLKNSKKKK